MPPAFDLLCLSHLRWDFVYQRPQHLLSRCARARRVFFIEEPLFDDGPARLEVSTREHGVRVVVPHIRAGLSETQVEALLQALLEEFLRAQAIEDYVLWYYTPMALGFTRSLAPLGVVYDCMDELSAFRGAPRVMRDREAELFALADVVFTGGQSLYESKRGKHPNVHAFPSSVDTAHFRQARAISSDPADQASILRPRLGFYGVIDERMDIDLLNAVAAERPEWQVVMVGPIVKIDPADLPRRPNIHYLGSKTYQELPSYLAGWDVALMPFARNESTKFISPTKTPEYLAAGKPVVSTSIRDVIRPYGEQGLVRIADSPGEFIDAVEAALTEDAAARVQKGDEFLTRMSWDRTWARMLAVIEQSINPRPESAPAASIRSVPAATLTDVSVRARLL